eukprot:3935504-Rhodomonas_salina.2
MFAFDSSRGCKVSQSRLEVERLSVRRRGSRRRRQRVEHDAATHTAVEWTDHSHVGSWHVFLREASGSDQAVTATLWCMSNRPAEQTKILRLKGDVVRMPADRREGGPCGRGGNLSVCPSMPLSSTTRKLRSIPGTRGENVKPAQGS